MHHIWNIAVKNEEKFLRAKTRAVEFGARGELRSGDIHLTRKDIEALVRNMRKTMREANGVGLSANQIGLPLRMFVAAVPSDQGETRFYTVFNPILERMASQAITLEEGCLSIPETYGDVPRAETVVLRGLDKQGKPLKIKAWGLLARVFQHEVDHLDGKLFIDRTKNVRRPLTAV
jgi:peptide deformylase